MELFLKPKVSTLLKTLVLQALFHVLQQKKKKFSLTNSVFRINVSLTQCT